MEVPGVAGNGGNVGDVKKAADRLVVGRCRRVVCVVVGVGEVEEGGDGTKGWCGNGRGRFQIFGEGR